MDDLQIDSNLTDGVRAAKNYYRANQKKEIWNSTIYIGIVK